MSLWDSRLGPKASYLAQLDACKSARFAFDEAAKQYQPLPQDMVLGVATHYRNPQTLPPAEKTLHTLPSLNALERLLQR